MVSRGVKECAYAIKTYQDGLFSLQINAVYIFCRLAMSFGIRNHPLEFFFDFFSFKVSGTRVC